jgi:hypothetical protein
VIALQEVQKEMKEVSDKLKAIEEDVRKSHPGYYFDLKAGSLVKIPPPTPSPKK